MSSDLAPRGAAGEDHTAADAGAGAKASSGGHDDVVTVHSVQYGQPSLS